MIVILNSCSTIEKAGVKMISDVMAGSGSGEIFTSDEDPQLIKDALPFILKMYEMLVEKNPEDADLLLATGSTFIMYSNIFIQTPAGMLPDNLYMEQFNMLKRSKKMYQRGTEYILRAIELNHKGFREQLEAGYADSLMDEMVVEDIPYLYWAASGLMAAFSCDPFDFDLGPNIYIPVTFIYKALEMDETYNKGALHDLLILMNSSLPESLMFKKSMDKKSETAEFAERYYNNLNITDPARKAEYHFRRSVDISEGKNASPYISFASTVAVNEQNYEQFISLLNKALEIDPDSFPEMRLAGIIYQDKAQWLLDHDYSFFLLDTDEGDYDEIY